jgi:hypothetical protein
MSMIPARLVLRLECTGFEHPPERPTLLTAGCGRERKRSRRGGLGKM